MIDNKSKDKLLFETAELYFDVRDLYIQSEERISDMKMFLAPLVEERDALDHLMIYFRNSFDKAENDERLGEIKEAQGHLLRAYFDIADYICIRIRQYIDGVLGKMKPKQIIALWSEYKVQREKIVEFSETLSKVRKERRGSIESIESYKKEIIPAIFEIYNNFRINVEIKIRTKQANP